MNCNNPEGILSTLPRDYTVEMALRNHDVLYTPEGQSYNVERLQKFMSNVDRCIPDCIIITTFGIEPPAVTAVLYYDGENIVYSYDSSRVSPSYKIQTFYGTSIFAETKKHSQFNITYYYLNIPGRVPFYIFIDILEI
jgi:hypothetical protein